MSRQNPIRDFVKIILDSYFTTEPDVNAIDIYENSPLLQYINLKTGAIDGNTKTRRSLANIYAIFSILYYYKDEYYNKPEEYKGFHGYDYTKLFLHYRRLYGGEKLQNHALNSRVNGEFANKIVGDNQPELIIINGSKYLLNIRYLYTNGIDISILAYRLIEEYISLLQEKDNKLINDIEKLVSLKTTREKKEKVAELLDERSEARIFEIISYAVLKSHYKEVKVYIGYSVDDLEEMYLTLYKTGRTNANDGGIDFVMRPLGRFFQVTEVNDYNKYLLDMDKVMHFPITFVIKTSQSINTVKNDINTFIEEKSGGMEVIKARYKDAIEEIITINELKKWLFELHDESINAMLRDIDLYYKLELNLPLAVDDSDDDNNI